MVSKRLVLLSCIAMIVSIISAPVVYADIIITADQSCRTDIENLDTNRHDSSKLSIRSDARSAKSWIKFDLGDLDVTSLETATFTVALHDGKSDDRHFDVSYVNDDCLDNIDWDERTLTWNNAPGNDAADFGALDTSKTTLVATVNFTDGIPGDAFIIDILEAIETDTDGIVQFVCHNSNGLLNLATHDHAEEAWRPFISVTEESKAKAKEPYPAMDANNVVLTPVLSWTPGVYVEGLSPKHKIFFSEDFNDVNDGIGGVTQDANYYASGSSLDFSTTYYWRVDEANSVSGWNPGDVWLFTTEPVGYPIPGENITVTASSSDTDPNNTINGSGLDVDDLHSTVVADMWLSEAGEPNSAWIQYEFDKPYKLHQMLVWNYNGQSFFTGFGLKDVTIAYSTDGVDWIQINDIFAQAPGTAGYAPNTTIEFGGVAAKMVMITANSNWGTSALYNQYGLSEVQFLQIPVSARLPIPESGAADVAIDVTLGWRAGREAAEHIVYISAEEQAVRDGTVSGVTVLQENYGPLSLNLASMYYWRIDEVNNLEIPAVWQGNTWSFTTSEYLVVDDFESYNTTDRQIWETWLDGLGFGTPGTPDFNPGNGTGSAVGDENSPSYMEETIVHSGSKSLPLMYDNSVFDLSEVTVSTADLAIGSDWTKGSPEQLTLWFYGDPANAATDQMYVKVNSAKKIFDGSLAQSDWQEFPIDLASLGIDLSNVTTLTIGFERTGVTGGSGMIFIDDIWLYTPAISE